MISATMTANETCHDAPPAALAANQAGNLSTALFLDVDGTLLDIAEGPSEVVTPPGLVAALAQAERKLAGALALISGRPIDELDDLFEPLRLRASGVHGAQMRFDPEGATQSAPGARELPTALCSSVTEALREFPGTYVENKRFSIAVHYRRTPSVGPRLHQILKQLIAAPPQVGIELIDARRAFELKLSNCDKGKAISKFLGTAPFRGNTPVFVGDDTTDESGFAAVVAGGGLAYSVGRRRPGVHGVFNAPQDVRAWLTAFATTDGARANL